MGDGVRLGTHVRLPDGREGTVVFNGLVGVGIKWGLHYPNPQDFKGTHGDFIAPEQPMDNWEWHFDVLLREPELAESVGVECVGEEYAVLYVPDEEPSP